MAHLTTFEGLHQLHYLGALDIENFEQALKNEEPGQSFRSIEERVIDQVELAQLNSITSFLNNFYYKISEKLPRSSQNKSSVVAVHVSKNGIKFVRMSDQHVLDRLPLYKIIQSISYDDGFGHYNVILLAKISNSIFQCHLLQSNYLPEAEHLCKQVRQAFASVEADTNS